MRSRLAPLVAALACALALVAASSASAALVTLGPSLEGTFGSSQNCQVVGRPDPCQTLFPISYLSGATTVSPVDGTIVSWSMKGGEAPYEYSLRVLSRVGLKVTGVSTSEPVVPEGKGIETFSTRMPINRGQTIGIDLPAAAPIAINEVAGAKSGFVKVADGATATADGERTGEEALSAVIQPTPTVAAIAPASGGAGTPVTITGADFEGASAVSFGAVPAASFAVNSESQITAVAPAGIGAVPISVTTVAGTAVSSQVFAYGAAVGPPAPTCQVPRLKGKTLKAAKRRIRNADCSVGKLTKKKGATAKDGEVVKQVPKPGATVPVDTKVKVTLAP